MVYIYEVCQYIKNWFIKDAKKDIHKGTFKVENGNISPQIDFLENNQYYRIKGSILNDGVYQFNDGISLIDEGEFIGEIWAMSIPKDLLIIFEDIKKWDEKYGSVDGINSSPFASETYSGVYSYTKKSSSSSNGTGDGVYSWQDAFRERLNKWRKI